ncbi:MAG: endonuclease III [Deferribacteraceae bacterium]|nr:endonuclease III [Deferribacteraceae bacterium]
MNSFKCPLIEKIQNEKARMYFFLGEIQKRYPNPVCALTHSDAFQLITATILSAQCTDVAVNKVTPALFAKYPTPTVMAEAKQADVEKIIHSTGFYKNKAKNLIAMAKMLVTEFGGKAPDSMEELVKLPGVGRKTANVVLGNIFKVPGVVVDTHVMRISDRLGFVPGGDPVKTERALEKLVPQKEWINFSHQVILLGRDLCAARRPLCGKCPVNPEYHIIKPVS